MKTRIQAFILAACALALVGTVYAGESVTGIWKAKFDSQIGVQKYTYVFKADGTHFTGTAHGEREMGTNTVAITDGTITGNEVSFVEPFKFQDQTIPIKYEGKVSGDEIKFTRHVGDFATEELVAHRVKAGDMKSGAGPKAESAGKAATNSPTAKP